MPKQLLYIFFMAIILCGCERPTDNTQTDDGIPPAVPSNPVIYYSADGVIGLEWEQNFEADFRGFNVYRKTSDSAYSKIAFTQENYYIDDSLEYNINYYYRLSSVDIWGRESSLSDEINAEPVNKYKPSIPRYVEINARNWEGEKSIYLSWYPIADTDVKGYLIYRDINSAFTADSTTLTGFTNENSFTDTSDFILYKRYYYKIKAIDKGELLSDESAEVSDAIYEIAEIIYPANDSYVPYFENLEIATISVPASYKIVVQENKYFDEIWSTQFHSDKTNDIIEVKFTPSYLYSDKKYYWRVITYSDGASGPNSISGLYSFTIKP